MSEEARITSRWGRMSSGFSFNLIREGRERESEREQDLVLIKYQGGLCITHCLIVSTKPGHDQTSWVSISSVASETPLQPVHI